MRITHSLNSCFYDSYLIYLKTMNCEDNMCTGTCGTHSNNYVREVTMRILFYACLCWYKYPENGNSRALTYRRFDAHSCCCPVETHRLFQTLQNKSSCCYAYRIDLNGNVGSIKWTFSYVFTLHSMRGVLWKFSLPQYYYLAKIIVVITCFTQHFYCMLTFFISKNMRRK
jgi:hypothetical protein